MYNNGTLTVGGTATVTGNSPNVYLAGGTTITLNSELDESARIGITAEMQSSLTDTAASIIVVKGGAAALNCFFPDDDGTYDLSDASGSSDIILHLIRDHTHCACAHKAKYAKDIGNHTEHVDREFVAWTDELVKEQYGSNTMRSHRHAQGGGLLLSDRRCDAGRQLCVDASEWYYHLHEWA